MVSDDLELIKDYSGRDYRSVWHGPRASFEDELEDKIIRALLPTEPGWFVDVGAGYGRLYPLYAQPGRKVVMVDYASNLLELAAQSHGGESDVYFVAANAYHLPFRPGSFGAGLSIRTFHHMAYPKRFLAELGRVFRRDARVVLEYSNKRNLLRAIRYGRRAFRRDHEHYGELLFGIHPAYFAELAGSAGFEVARTAGTGLLTRLATERTRPALRLLNAAESVLDSVVGKRDLAPKSFADLRKIDGPAQDAGSGFRDLLQCPACAGAVDDHADGMHCAECGNTYPRIGAVLDFRYVGPR